MKKISPASVNWQSTFMRWIAVINCCNCLGKKKPKKSKGLVFFIASPRKRKKATLLNHSQSLWPLWPAKTKGDLPVGETEITL